MITKKKIAFPEDDELSSKNDSFVDFTADVISGKTHIVKINSAQHKLGIINDGLLTITGFVESEDIRKVK